MDLQRQQQGEEQVHTRQVRHVDHRWFLLSNPTGERHQGQSVQGQTDEDDDDVERGRDACDQQAFEEVNRLIRDTKCVQDICSFVVFFYILRNDLEELVNIFCVLYLNRVRKSDVVTKTCNNNRKP